MLFKAVVERASQTNKFLTILKLFSPWLSATIKEILSVRTNIFWTRYHTDILKIQYEFFQSEGTSFKIFGSSAQTDLRNFDFLCGVIKYDFMWILNKSSSLPLPCRFNGDKTHRNISSLHG